MRGQDVEHFLAIVLAAAGLDLVSEHDLLAVVVHARLELEAAALPRVRNRPTRERARHFLHVLLRVAAVDAKRVQFHQLARVVLVQSARPAILAAREVGDVLTWHARSAPASEPAAARWPVPVVALGGRALGCGTLPVVEIEEHRWTLSRRAQQLAELAEDVRSDRVAFVLGEVVAAWPLPANTLKWLNQKSTITSFS